MAINFAVDEKNALSVCFSHEINSLECVGEIPISTEVQNMVNKKVSDLNLISEAIETISTFKNTQHSSKLFHDLRNMRQQPEFALQMEKKVKDYCGLGFSLAEVEILVHSSMTKKKPHRTAPPPPFVRRPIVPPPPPPPSLPLLPPPPPPQPMLPPLPPKPLQAHISAAGGGELVSLGTGAVRRRLLPSKPANDDQMKGE